MWKSNRNAFLATKGQQLTQVFRPRAELLLLKQALASAAVDRGDLILPICLPEYYAGR